MQNEQAERLAQLLFQAAPPFRRNYIKPSPPEKIDGFPRIPHHHVFCLLILKKSGRESMGVLAEKLGVSNQQCTRIVGELEENGLAARAADEKNRRLVYVTPTEKGTQLLTVFYRHACEHIREQLGALPDEDVDELIAHLAGIVRILDKLG